MKPQLSIRLPGPELTPETMVDWALFTQPGQAPEVGRTSLADIGRKWGKGRQGPPVTVIVPAIDVLLTETRIPSRQLRQIKKALPYMVEELIAEPIEHVHLGIPSELPEGDEMLSVAVVRHERLIPWLDALYGQGLKLVALLPETLALPWRPQTWSLLVNGERVLWRDGTYHGFELPLNQLPALVEWLAGEKVSPPPRLQLFTVGDNPEVDALAVRLREQLPYEVESLHFEHSLWEVLAIEQHRDPEHNINLLQGGYKVQEDYSALKTGWRVAAAVAGIGLVSYALITLASSAWFNWRAQQLEGEAVALHRELFPEVRRVVSPRRQMASRLRGGGSTGDLMPLLAGAAQLDGRLTLEQLRFRSASGELQLEVQTDSLERLDSAKQVLSQAGFSAEVASASEAEGVTRGRLLVKGAGR